MYAYHLSALTSVYHICLKTIRRATKSKVHVLITTLLKSQQSLHRSSSSKKATQEAAQSQWSGRRFSSEGSSLSLSSNWVGLYAVCFLSCVPVWPCCLTTVVNPRSFFFETSLCFLSNSLGWFESKLVADCWCYCFEVLFLTSSFGGLGLSLWCHRCFDASKILSPLRGVLSQTRCLLHTIQCSLRQQVGPNPLLQICIFSKNATSKDTRFWGGWRLFDTISTCSNMFCTNIGAKYQFVKIFGDDIFNMSFNTFNIVFPPLVPNFICSAHLLSSLAPPPHYIGETMDFFP